MARKRMLSASFFTSAPVNRLSIPAMVTYAGLWVYFDDYGRGEDDVSLVKATVWPRRRSITEKMVGAHLDEIVGERLACRYEVGGVALLHAPSWHEHQKVSHPTDSTLPPCPVHEPMLSALFERDSGGPLERFRNSSRATLRSVVEVSSVEGSSGDGPCDHGYPTWAKCTICRRVVAGLSSADAS